MVRQRRTYVLNDSFDRLIIGFMDADRERPFDDVYPQFLIELVPVECEFARGVGLDAVILVVISLMTFEAKEDQVFERRIPWVLIDVR